MREEHSGIKEGLSERMLDQKVGALGGRTNWANVCIYLVLADSCHNPSFHQNSEGKLGIHAHHAVMRTAHTRLGQVSRLSPTRSRPTAEG